MWTPVAGQRRRIGLLRLAAHVAAPALLAASPCVAAEIRPLEPELRRGFQAVGDKASEEPALRLERQTRDPSPAFMLGTALGAWSAASDALNYDLANPSGDGDDSAAIEMDCYDEKLAFDHLEARRQALDLTPEEVVTAVGARSATLAASWATRKAGAPPRCR